MTLNMARRSRINLRLLAYQQIKGNYDFHWHPMGIAGCKTIVHLLPNEGPCYNLHKIDGFYIEPAMDSFRNFICYVPSRGGVPTSTLALASPSPVTWFTPNQPHFQGRCKVIMDLPFLSAISISSTSTPQERWWSLSLSLSLSHKNWRWNSLLVPSLI